MANDELQKLVGELRAKLPDMLLRHRKAMATLSGVRPGYLQEDMGTMVDALPILLAALDSQARVCEAAGEVVRQWNTKDTSAGLCRQQAESELELAVSGERGLDARFFGREPLQ